MKILLDTHALIWLTEGSRQLGERAISAIERAKLAGTAFVSSISFWEIGMLEHGGQVDIAGSTLAWRRSVLNAGIVELPVDGWIAVEATDLHWLRHRDGPRDVANRLIVATALHEDLTLITADQIILDWQGKLARLDASR
jgi:PIN domain nuclease of toxin-antitoxin system